MSTQKSSIPRAALARRSKLPFASAPSGSLASTSSQPTSLTPPADVLLSERERVLETAASLTSSDRNETYGDCLENHQAFGELLSWWDKWSGNLECKHGSHNAAIVHVLTKLTRIAVGRFHRDNYIDGAAYLAIACECEIRERNVEACEDPSSR